MIVYDWTKSRFSGNPWGGWNPVSLASSRYKRLKASQEVVNTTPSGHCSCRSAATGPVPRIRTRSSLPFLSLVCSNENAPAFYDLREVSIPNEPSKNMITTSLHNPFTNIYVYIYIHILSIQVDLPESVTMVLPFPISIDIFQDISGNSSFAPFPLPMLWTLWATPPPRDDQRPSFWVVKSSHNSSGCLCFSSFNCCAEFRILSSQYMRLSHAPIAQLMRMCTSAWFWIPRWIDGTPSWSVAPETPLMKGKPRRGCIHRNPQWPCSTKSWKFAENSATVKGQSLASMQWLTMAKALNAIKKKLNAGSSEWVDVLPLFGVTDLVDPESQLDSATAHIESTNAIPAKQERCANLRSKAGVCSISA